MNWLTHLVFWIYPTRKVNELSVTIVSSDRAVVERLCQKVAASLELLLGAYPRGHRMVVGYVEHVIVAYLPSTRGEWWEPSRSCVLSLEYVDQETTDPSAIASLLLHEAMHGRLERLGFRYTSDFRIRLETVCRKAEIEFARRLPDRDVRLAQLEEDLGRLAESYADARLLQVRHSDLQKLGAPSWLIRAVERLSRRRAA